MHPEFVRETSHQRLAGIFRLQVKHDAAPGLRLPGNVAAWGAVTWLAVFATAVAFLAFLRGLAVLRRVGGLQLRHRRRELEPS